MSDERRQLPGKDLDESAEQSDSRAGRQQAMRWLRRLLIAGGVAAILLPIVIAVLWFFVLPSQSGSAQAIAFLNRQLAQVSNLHVSIQGIQPTWRGLFLEQIQIEIEEGGQSFSLFQAPRARISLSLWELIRQKPQIFVVQIEEPILTLHFDREGSALVPVFQTPSDSLVIRAEPETVTEFRDGIRLILNEAEFRVSREQETRVWWTDGELEVEARPRTEGYAIELTRGEGFLPQLGLVVRTLQGQGVASTRGVVVEELEIETDAGTLEGEGSLLEGELDVDLSASQWPWEFFAEILEQPAFDVPGTVAIRARVHGELETPIVESYLDGQWRQESFVAQLAGRLVEEGIRLDQASLSWGGAQASGSGLFRLNGQWHLDARVEALDLSKLERLAPQLSLPVSSLGGPVRIVGDQGKLTVNHDRLDGHISHVPVQNLVGQWSLVAGRVEWQAQGGMALGEVGFRGFWDGKELFLLGNARDVSVDQLSRLHPALQDVRYGSSDLRFELSGPPQRLLLSVQGDLREARWRTVEFEQVEMVAVGIWGGGRDSVRLSVIGQDVLAGPVPIDSVNAQIEWHAGWFAVPQVTLARADTLVRGSFVAREQSGVWQIRAFPAGLQAGSTRLRAEDELLLEVGPEGFHFQSFRLLGDAGRLELSGWYRPEGDTSLRLTTQDLDLASLLGALDAPDPMGRVNINASLTGDGAEMQLQCEVGAEELWYGDAAVSEVEGKLVAKRTASRVEVQQLELSTSAGSVIASGHAELNRTGGRSPEAWWKPLTTVPAWQGSVQVSALDMTVISDLLANENEFRGLVTGRLELLGHAGNRTGVTGGEIIEPGFNGYRLDRVRWSASYQNNRLEFDWFDIGIGEESIRLTGRTPLELAWGEVTEEWFPEKPIEFEVELPEGSLRYLPLFLPQIAAAEGRVAAEITVRGTPRDPSFHGRITIEDAAIRVSQREEIYRKVDAVAILEGNLVRIESIKAEQRDGGKLSGGGYYIFSGADAGDYRLEMRARNALARASGEYAVSFDGDFMITDGPRLEGQLIATPSIKGNVKILSGVILYDFSDPENVVYLTGPKQAPMYVYEIELEAPGRVFWRTPSSNIELEADLTMSQTINELKMWGNVRSLRGTYYFLENKFRVESGELVFDQAESMNPKIEAQALTTVTRALSQAEYEKEEIHIELTGRIMKPELRIWSSSGLSQTDIVSLLTFGKFGIGNEALSSQDTRLLVGVTGTQYLVRQLAREVPEFASILSDIEVGTTVGEGTTGERIYTTIGVSRYFTPDLRLRYSQVVGGDSGPSTNALNLWDVSAEYRIGRIFYLTGEVNGRRASSAQGQAPAQNETTYNLDVRARYEY